LVVANSGDIFFHALHLKKDVCCLALANSALSPPLALLPGTDNSSGPQV
jgi:hypothetical protein